MADRPLPDRPKPGGRGQPLLRFVERIGGSVVAPRAVFADFWRGGAGGFNDFLIVLTLLAVGLQPRQLAQAAWTLVDISVTTGAMLMLQVLARMMIWPLGAVVIGGVLLKALTRETRTSRHLDAAALCALPALAVQLLFSVVAVLLPQLYQPWMRQLVLGAGLSWFVALLLVARSVARDAFPIGRREA